jgi:glutamate-1-semialdehyde 2,1-aminomutase
VKRFVDAARAMREGGWWWDAPELTNKGIKRGILHEMLRVRFGKFGPSS